MFLCVRLWVGGVLVLAGLVMLAMPWALSGAVPSYCVPSRKVRGPVGVPPLPRIVAVRVRGAPEKPGLAEGLSARWVVASCTICAMGAEVLAE